MKQLITESLRYWEPRRIIYNVALALVLVGSMLWRQAPFSELTWQRVVSLLVAAAVANVLYCSAYVVDVFVQLSDYAPAWRRRRWLLLAAGTLLAAAIFLLHG